MQDNLTTAHNRGSDVRVGKVTSDELGARGDFVQGTGGQIVHHANIMAVRQQIGRQMRTDKSRPAGDKKHRDGAYRGSRGKNVRPE